MAACRLIASLSVKLVREVFKYYGGHGNPIVNLDNKANLILIGICCWDFTVLIYIYPMTFVRPIQEIQLFQTPFAWNAAFQVSMLFFRSTVKHGTKLQADCHTKINLAILLVSFYFIRKD